MILEIPDSGTPCEETILIADSGLGSRTTFPSESEFLFLENLDSESKSGQVILGAGRQMLSLPWPFTLCKEGYTDCFWKLTSLQA